MIKATLLLCDFAQVAEGKLFISGGGWSYTNRLNGYIGALLQIPWEYAQRHVKGSISLVDAGDVVVLDPSGEPAFRLVFELEVAPRTNAARDQPLDAPLAIPLPTMELALGGYKLIFEIEGETDSDWVLPFRILDATNLGSQSPSPTSHI